MNVPGRGAGRVPPIVTQPPVSRPDDWDTGWIMSDDDFEKLPDSALARQHDGWEELGAPSSSKEARGREPDGLRDAEYFPHAALSLPVPKLDFDFRMAVKLNCQVSRVQVPGAGVKDLTTAFEGKWSASFGRGLVTSGGHDLQVSQPAERTRSKVDTAFRLETNDGPPAVLEMRTRGYVAYEAGTLERIVKCDGNSPDPRSYAVRMVMTLRTEDERYSDQVNLALWMGSAIWVGREMILDAYRIS